MEERNTRICKQCNVEKSIENFYFCRSKKGQWRTWKCDSCQKENNKIRWNNLSKDEKLIRVERGRKYKEKNIERYKVNMKKYGLKRFNLSLEEYNDMLEEQDYVCAICSESEKIKGPSGDLKSLAVDHCHKTNEVRGLLCNKCNQALGLFGDNKNILYSAYSYLEQYEKPKDYSMEDIKKMIGDKLVNY